LNKKVEELSKVTARVGKGGSAADKAKKEELEITQKVLKLVAEDKKDVRKGDWNNKEVEIINSLQLLTAKPVIYLVNLSEKDYIRKKNKWLPKIKIWVDENNPGDPIIPFSASVEYQHSILPTKEEKDKFLSEKDAQSAFSRIILAGYQALQLMYFFTCGPDEVRAWTIRKQTKAPKAAGAIHTDFEKSFILVEIMKFDDLKEHGNEAAVKAAGKYLQKGKEYIFEDGDIAYFRAGLANKK
jgi:obg-like ATPase 1